MTTPPVPRIAYITMRYPLPSETFVTNEVRAIRALGLDITVMSVRGRSSQETEALIEARGVSDIPIVRADSLTKLGWQRLLSNPLRWLQDLIWLCRINKGQLRTMLHQAWLYPAAVGAAALIKHAAFDVTFLRWGHHPALVGSLLKRWDVQTHVSLSLSAYDLEARLAVTKELASKADSLRTHARINVADIVDALGIPENAVEVIYNGVPDELISMENNIDKQSGLIVTAGRLIASKRVDDTIRAFALLHSTHPNSQLQILGDGPERHQLENLVRELNLEGFVTFHGMVPYQEVVMTMRRAEIFIMMSNKSSERLPNVIKEAMAARCSVVATYTPGIDELVSDEQTGFLVEPGDTLAAADAMSRLMSDAGLRSDFGRRGLDHIRHNFSLSKCASKYLCLWQLPEPAPGAKGA